ncbi:MAG: hypothetical protein US60_C0042G0002 [Microgenomates group bacterium GW2011_GWC1_37_8]|nr:MAG: hypothetical protein US60_C0042G0002 [Microgenomates group bacterium GW2011_GWC1_37_8]
MLYFNKYIKRKLFVLSGITFISFGLIVFKFSFNPNSGVVKNVQAAVNGTIIKDPQHPNRMTYSGLSINGHPKPVLLCGPGDPEDFFYNNTSGNLDFLTTQRDAKTTYITAYLKDRCSGSCTPGTGVALDQTLATWQGYLDKLEDAGVTTVFFFYDDGVGLPSDWQTSVPKIVNKLKVRANGIQRKLLIWSVAEEYSEGLTQTQVANVAALIRQNDSEHIIGVHQLPGNQFDFNSNNNLSMFLMQINYDDINTMNTQVNAAWDNVNGNKILNMSENIDHALDNRTLVRQRNWAAVMGGASIVQVHQMGRASDPSAWNDPAKYSDCNNLTSFMEATRVNFMEPNNSLKSGTTEWVLAEAGYSYILYTRNGGNPGVTNMTVGNYNLTWLDAISGNKIMEAKSVGSGTQSFVKPTSFGNELVLYLVKTEGPTPTPVLKQGDANGDGKVDGRDLVIWIKNYGISTTSGASVGDFNLDKTVNIYDYTVWIANYLR